MSYLSLWMLYLPMFSFGRQTTFAIASESDVTLSESISPNVSINTDSVFKLDSLAVAVFPSILWHIREDKGYSGTCCVHARRWTYSCKCTIFSQHLNFCCIQLPDNIIVLWVVNTTWPSACESKRVTCSACLQVTNRRDRFCYYNFLLLIGKLFSWWLCCIICFVWHIWPVRAEVPLGKQPSIRRPNRQIMRRTQQRYYIADYRLLNDTNVDPLAPNHSPWYFCWLYLQRDRMQFSSISVKPSEISCSWLGEEIIKLQ